MLNLATKIGSLRDAEHRYRVSSRFESVSKGLLVWILVGYPKGIAFPLDHGTRRRVVAPICEEKSHSNGFCGALVSVQAVCHDCCKARKVLLNSHERDRVDRNHKVLSRRPSGSVQRTNYPSATVGID